METGITDSGVESLSKALKVNSSITDLLLNAWVFCWMMDLCYLLLCRNRQRIPLVLKGQSHYQMRWQSIRHSFIWVCIYTHWLLLLKMLMHDIDNRIGPLGAQSLSEALKVNSTLAFLDLYVSFYSLPSRELSYFIENDIGPKGASHMSEALKVNSSLTELSLHFCSFYFSLFLTSHCQQYWWWRSKIIIGSIEG